MNHKRTRPKLHRKWGNPTMEGIAEKAVRREEDRLSLLEGGRDMTPDEAIDERQEAWARMELDELSERNIEEHNGPVGFPVIFAGQMAELTRTGLRHITESMHDDELTEAECVELDEIMASNTPTPAQIEKEIDGAMASGLRQVRRMIESQMLPPPT